MESNIYKDETQNMKQSTSIKGSFYFQHDYNARNDPKLQRLLMKCGCEGIGIYWCIIEQLYEQGGKLPNNHIETIAFNLHTTQTTVEKVVFELNLFVFDDEFFWSESLLKRLESRTQILSKRSEAGKKGGAPIGNKNASKKVENNDIESSSGNSDNQMVECETTTNKQMVEKNKQKQAIKGKEIKGKEIYISTSLHSVESVDAKSAKRFCPPTLSEVKDYAGEIGYASLDAERFIDFYSSKGWMVGKNKMKDWRAAVRNWRKSEKKINNNQTSVNNSINDEWK